MDGSATSARKKGTAKPSSFAGVVSLLVWIALLVGLPAGLYALYVLGQLDAIKQRDLRVLGETAEAIDNIVGTAAKNLDVLVGDLKSKQAFEDEFFDRQANLTKAGDLESCRAGTGQTNVRFFDSGDLSFKCVPEEDNGSSGDDVAVANKDTGYEDAEAVVPDGDQCEVCPQPSKNETNPVAVARLDLRKVLENAPSTTTINLVAVVNEKGRVVARHVPQPGFRLAAGAENTQAIRIRDISGLTEPDAAEGAGNGEPPAVDKSKLTDITALKRVTVAETAYELACQPLKMPLDSWTRNHSNGQSNALSVCGFVSENQARQEALQIAPTLLLVLVALTALGVLAWPILKVFSMAPTERLSFGDIYFMLLSISSIILFVTIAWLDAGLYRSLRDQAFSSLRDTAKQVEDNIESEFSDLHRQLCRYEDELVANKDELSRRNDWNHTDLFKGESGEPGFVGLGAPEVPTLFNSFFWMLNTDKEDKNNGMQLIKGTIRTKNTPRVNVSSRDYFSRVQNDRLWQVSFIKPCEESIKEPESGAGSLRAAAPDRTAEKVEIFVQSARSITTGEFFMALSFRSALELVPGDWLSSDEGKEPSDSDTESAPINEGEASKLVAAISGSMISFQHAALSPGLEISVVDRDGTAVFHSDKRRVRFERIFRDEGVGVRIRSAINGGGVQCFAGAYRGQPRLMCVRQMEQLPWTIVVSLQQRFIFTANLELLATVAAFAVAYLILLVIITMLLVVFRGRTTPRWMWPHLLDNRAYWKWNGVGLAGLLLICVVAAGLDSTTLLIVGPLIWAGLLLLMVTYSTERTGVDPREYRKPINGFCASAILLWLLVAVVPAKGLFDAAVDIELPRAAVAEQLSLIRRLEQRACAIADGYERLRFGDGDSGIKKETVIESRTADLRGIYRFGLFQPEKGEACQSQQDWDPIQPEGRLGQFQEILALLKPIYNESATGLRYIGLSDPHHEDGESEGETSGVWRPYDYHAVRAGSLTRIDPPPSDCQANFEIARCGKIQGHRLPTSPWMWVIAIGLGALFAAFQHYVVRRMFFGAVNVRESTKLQKLLKRPPENLTFAIVSTNWQRRTLLQQKKFPTIDLAKALPVDMPADAGAVIVTGLDEGLDDQPERYARLMRLESLFQQGGAAPIVLMFLDPRRLVQICGRPSGNPGSDGKGLGIAEATPAELNTWHRLLNQGKCFYVSAVDYQETKGYWFEHCFWSVCDAEERLVLYQVATTGFTNPKQYRSVRRLLSRGLLQFDPSLTVTDSSFRKYIRRECDPDQLKEALESTGGMDSRRARWVLAAVLAVIVGFLSTTQPQIVETWMQFIIAASAGAAALLKVSSSMFGSSHNS